MQRLNSRVFESRCQELNIASSQFNKLNRYMDAMRAQNARDRQTDSDINCEGSFSNEVEEEGAARVRLSN